MDLPFEQFPALSAVKICRHVFAQRIPGIDVSHDKAEVLERLDVAHREIRNATGFGVGRCSPPNRSTVMKLQSSVTGLRSTRTADAVERRPYQPRISRMRRHYHQSTRCRARHLRRRLLRGLHRRSQNACDWPCAFRPQRHRPWRRHKRDQTNDSTLRLRSREHGRATQSLHSPTPLRSRFRR